MLKRLAIAFAALCAVAAVAIVLTRAPAAGTGELYLDGTGYAVSGYDVVSYFDLPQSPLGAPQPAPQRGRTAITADYNGATFAFATEANRARFLADPAAFAPQYGGHCAYGVAQGSKVPGSPILWRIVDGKLYLNITKEVVASWEEDIPGHVANADGRWDRVKAKRLGVRDIPGFTSPGPEKG